MNKKLSRLIEPNIQPIIVCLFLFVVIAIPFQPMLALVEAVFTVVLYVVLQSSAKKRKKTIMQYIDGLTGGLDSASKNVILNAPLPILVFRADNQEVVWSSDSFMEIAGDPDGLFFNMRLEELIPNFSCQWVMNGDRECPDRVYLGDRVYRVFGSTNRLSTWGTGSTGFSVPPTGSAAGPSGKISW